MMAKIISVHEHKLKDGVASQQFEAAVEDARKAELFSLPGLLEYHFLRCIILTLQLTKSFRQQVNFL